MKICADFFLIEVNTHVNTSLKLMYLKAELTATETARKTASVATEMKIWSQSEVITSCQMQSMQMTVLPNKTVGYILAASGDTDSQKNHSESTAD